MIEILKQTINTTTNKQSITTSSNTAGERVVNSGLRSNIFQVEFIDNEKSSLTNQITAIVTQLNSISTPTNVSTVYSISDFELESLKKYVKSVSGIPERTAPDAQEFRTPFISYRYQSVRQSFDTISISFIEPFGTLIKQIFKYYIYQYIINPVYNVIQEQNIYKFAIRVTHYSNILETSLGSTTNLPAAKQYTFFGQFPTTVNGLQLAYDSTEPITTDITFAYDYWTVSDVTQTVDTIKNELTSSI